MNEGMLQELGVVRDEIDAIDAQMLVLLNERAGSESERGSAARRKRHLFLP